MRRTRFTAQEHAELSERMRREYQAQNNAIWRWFLRSGLDEAWQFIYRKPPERPDPLLHPERFRAELGLNQPAPFSGYGGSTVLENLVRGKLQEIAHAQKLRGLAWRKYRAAGGLTGSERRRVFMILATPEWADRKAMRAIYQEARTRNQLNGKNSWHVDHIVPLNNYRVCGLNVPNNLRIIAARENCRKSNSFDEELALGDETKYAPAP